MTGIWLTMAALVCGAGADEKEPADNLSVYEAREFVYSGGEYENETFRYRLMQPANIEPGKTYPVILFLHGAGERGTDNERQLYYLPAWMTKPERREKFPCFLIAPQCRPDKKWVDLDWSQKDSARMPEQPNDQMRVALGILEEVIKKFPVDKQRVYLTGLSMGGYGSWDLAMRRPDLFAAVAPVCGGGDETQVAKIVNVPIYAYHGDEDKAVPVERTRRMIAALKAAGGSPKYKELPGVGHNSWTAAYRDDDGVVPWMFQQRKAEAPAAEAKK